MRRRGSLSDAGESKAQVQFERANIFQKLRLPPSPSDHCRVLAVLEFLRD
jgi:hypothetical protein